MSALKTLVAETSQVNVYTRHADHTVTAETSPQTDDGRATQQGQRRTSRPPVAEQTTEEHRITATVVSHTEHGQVAITTRYHTP